MWERRGGRTGGSFLGLMEIYGVLCFALYYNAVRGRVEKDHEMDTGQQGFLPEIARNGKHYILYHRVGQKDSCKKWKVEKIICTV